MRLYIGKNHDHLNRKPFDVENLHTHICLNPIYKNVTVSDPNTRILLDSGAFQDRKSHQRITLEEALERQLTLETQIGMNAERIVSYDCIDDMAETVAANKFLHDNRHRLPGRQLMLMLQGDTISNYVECLKQTLTFAQPIDCIGFGGVALSGRFKQVRMKLIEVFRQCLPLITQHGIQDIHIFGVGTFSILRALKAMTSEYPHVKLSCDTSSFEMQSVFGKVIDVAEERWVHKYSKEDKFTNYHPCDLTKENIIKAVQLVGGM